MARQPRKRLRPGDVKAVVFDAYGTIINFTEPDFIATMAEICADQSLDADANDLWRRFLRASYFMRSEHHFKAALADAPAFDDARPAIEAIGRHYKVALLSNADDDFLTSCLHRNGLRFKHVLTSEGARAIKPNPEIFLKMARRLRLPPEDILYVGDNPIPDVLGPVRAGMRTAWVNRGGYRKPRGIPFPDVRVKSLSELVSMLVPDVE